MAETRPLYWSVRRELWEHRSLTLGPLAVAAVALCAFLINIAGVVRGLRDAGATDPEKQRLAAVMPYSMVASVVLLTGFVVAAFYCLDALSGERRDRSILFWKSLPVSDRITIVAKAGIPLLVLPLLTCAVALATQLIMAVITTAGLIVSGDSPAALWTRVPLFQMSGVMLYGTLAHAFWFAPLYALLLLISAWARRAAFLWAVLPPVAIVMVERIAFGTSGFMSFLKYRLGGALTEAFVANAANAPITRAAQLTPARFLTAPGLWLGFLFAALCLAAAVRLRHRREAV